MGTSLLDSPVIGYTATGMARVSFTKPEVEGRVLTPGSPESGSEIFTGKRTGLDNRKRLHSIPGMLLMIMISVVLCPFYFSNIL